MKFKDFYITESNKYMIRNSKVSKEACKNHSYRWTGKMPNTGEYACVHCGHIKDKNASKRRINA
jgi:hypothetical protein